MQAGARPAPGLTTPTPSSTGTSSPKPSMSGVVARAKLELEAITGFATSSITKLQRTDEGWSLELELVEKEGIPDRMDILGTYRATFSTAGELKDYERIGLRKRGDTTGPIDEDA
jgi:hypothetical protein